MPALGPHTWETCVPAAGWRHLQSDPADRKSLQQSQKSRTATRLLPPAPRRASSHPARGSSSATATLGTAPGTQAKHLQTPRVSPLHLSADGGAELRLRGSSARTGCGEPRPRVNPRAPRPRFAGRAVSNPIHPATQQLCGTNPGAGAL